MRFALLVACFVLAACTTVQPPVVTSDLPTNNNPIQMNRDAAASRGPVRNLTAQPGEEIVTIRYWKIRKGTFPQFLEASETGIWPFFEKIGARIVGMWQVIPPPDGKEASPDYDEVYLTTRYASVEHWAATRDAAAMGGDGPDYAALQAALAVRQSLTIETKVTFLRAPRPARPRSTCPAPARNSSPAP
jgi:hypothetical protein